MAAAMITDRGLRKKLTQEAIPEKTPRKPSKRKSTASGSRNDKKNEQNNNKRPKIQTGDPKLDLFSTYQPWVIQTYGDLAKTKTITLKKYARILRTLRGEECNSSDSSKFRFWVKAKGFHIGKPQGYDAKAADGIVCRYSVMDAEGCPRGPDGQEIYSGSQNDPPLYIPTPPLKNAPSQDPVYRKVAIVENFFDIIYTVHVELEGRPGKHAGQKRTYRTITETYAFLPREAVTRFLTGCAECARRPRSASPPPLPTPSPSPTRHPTYLSFLPHCAPDYSRNWESEIDAAHSNYPYEPKYDYTDLQPLKKVESPKTADNEDPEPTYIELTSKKVNGFDADFSRSSPVDQAFREDEPSRTELEIDKDENSLIDVEDVKCDSPPPLLSHKPKLELKIKQEPSGESTGLTENSRGRENKTDVRERKYNPLDVANLTSKDPPKSRSPPRKKLWPTSLEYTNGFSRFPKPWRPDGGAYYGGEEMDYSVPITTAYLKHMRSMAYQERMDMENKDNLTPEPSDMNDDDNFSSQAFAKDAEKLKMMLLAWNYHSQPQGRNGDITESGADSMADLWASYHSALGLGSKPPKPPTPLATGHSSPIHIGSATPVEPASTHDETSSSDRTKDDDDGGASDDDSDDRVDPQHHDPERLKAFNMFVRLFVDENLDRIVPISKQPKEKIQAIIDSCTRQFPEFAERARKRIRTYLKSCRRNKKVRGDGPTTGNGGSTSGSGNAWDSAVRPTPAHLTSVQAEHILAQACENESLNAKRMRLGLDPVSQPMPTVPTPMSIDTTATSAVASSFLSLYSGAISSPASTQTTSCTTSLPTAGHSKAAADTTRPSASPTMENPLLNNNSLKIDNANGNAGSKTASPASSPAPLFRPSFPNTFGTPQTFGRPTSSSNPASSALSSSALLSTLSALPPTGVNAAMAAYQSALLSAMAAHTHTFPTGLSAPTDLSLKNTSTPAQLHSTPATSSLPAAPSSQTKPSLLSHKLSGAEVGAVRQLITGYRESAAFLLRSADELEALLLNQA
ncbi:nucleolar protein 4 [Amyelois transitella]|uniref:nucleolar protein 4 n=1 Tax=Amyelois transitella TaxID=680683 RepID=UPI00298F8EFE|nr:nucleolar protein 4 [Amyelois transitella]